MRNFALVFLVFLSFGLISTSLSAQNRPFGYLPKGITYNPEIPTPSSYLGYSIGEWHVSHDQLRGYLYRLAGVSDRIEIEEIGRTHENRPLLLLTISSPSNLRRIEDLKAIRSAWADPEREEIPDLDQVPMVAWMGYSIHGNEASGSHAAMLLAYYLAAAEGDAMDNMLDDMIILLDPCQNPDGLQRFSTWVNMHKGNTPVADPESREHRENWPNGRTNHYWFDLNRDWLPAQQPESRARLLKFQEWKPNLLTDFHEMGTQNSYFFQPGVPSRNNPIIPEGSLALSQKMAAFHAVALDSIGSLYFTRELFDDFYAGKGSTYPDLNGSVGILFEQGSARGHLQDSRNGLLSFPFAIRNHFTTSLSSLKGAWQLKDEFLNYQRSFFQEALEEAGRYPGKAFVFGSEKDPARSCMLAEILSLHQIRTYRPKQVVEADGKVFSPENSYLVPLKQPQFRLIRSIFEPLNEFEDSIFYDVSTWTLPYAFNLPFARVDKQALAGKNLGAPFSMAHFPLGGLIGDRNHYAFAFEWTASLAPGMLYSILKEGLKASVATRPFQTKEGISFEAGTILIPVQGQSMSVSEIGEFLESLAAENGISLFPVHSGLNREGPDLGSPLIVPLRLPRVLMAVGEGVSAYDAGEVWHLLDKRMGMEICLVEKESLNSTLLARYNTLLLVDGNYSGLTDSQLKAIRDWVSGGGILIATEHAVRWLADRGVSGIQFRNSDSDSGFHSFEPHYQYADKENEEGAKLIGGAICMTWIDRTHPLGFGFESFQLPVFRTGTLFMELSKDRYANPVVYAEDPLLSGYISRSNIEKLAGSAAVVVSRAGSGRIISMVDNPNFRGYWVGTQKLFLNGIFFGSIIR